MRKALLERREKEILLKEQEKLEHQEKILIGIQIILIVMYHQ
jgi:hypothetical protein